MSSENFKLSIIWQPNQKPFTYNDYSREYIIQGSDREPIIGTAAVSYKGSPHHYNPEEMMIAALSGCHMLSYLALAANAKLTILSYEDSPDGSLEKHGMSFKFKEITLRPQIKISRENDLDKAKTLHEKAHHICFIANSVNFPVHINPIIED